MNDDMYTYHYFRKRSISGVSRTPSYLVHTVVLSGLAYAAVTLLLMFT